MTGFRRTAAVTSLLACLLYAPSPAQQTPSPNPSNLQNPNPSGVPLIAGKHVDLSVCSGSSARAVSFVQALWGPNGDAAFAREGAGAIGEADRASIGGYFFPALYLLVSANADPAVTCKDDGDVDFEKQGLHQQWVKVTFTVEPNRCKDSSDCKSSPVRVIGLNPEKATGMVEKPPLRTGVETAGKMADTFQAFIPAPFSVASKATGILFQGLFPPIVAPQSFAFMNSANEFGWFFRENPETKTTTMGIQRMAAFLMVPKGSVQQIKLQVRIIAKWNQDIKKNEIDDEVSSGTELFLDVVEPVNPGEPKKK